MQREQHLALSSRGVRICCVNKLLKAASSCSGGRARAKARMWACKRLVSNAYCSEVAATWTTPEVSPHLPLSDA